VADLGSLGKRLERLEAHRVKVGGKRTSPELETYFNVLENYQLEQQGLPPIHHIDDGPDPELDAYFAELERQEQERVTKANQKRLWISDGDTESSFDLLGSVPASPAPKHLLYL
jgi:hypothetical protein